MKCWPSASWRSYSMEEGDIPRAVGGGSAGENKHRFNLKVNDKRKEPIRPESAVLQ